MEFGKPCILITMLKKTCRKPLKGLLRYIRVSVFDELCVTGNLTYTEHCLDYIRQSLQCGGDLAPMNWMWIEDTKKIFFKPGTPHTCRKFDAVWDWVVDRKVDWNAEEKHGFHP
jgi:hypothetical protein